MSSPQAREAFALAAEPDARPRPLRPDPVRPELPAGPPADRARRPVRDRQHVRDGLRRDHLGHPRLGAVHRSSATRTRSARTSTRPTRPCSKTCRAAGMLENTMVLAMGEFGRTPKINPAGGRDHHPACWTILIGGGPIKGGRVVGASDEIGYAPKDRPVTPPRSPRRSTTAWASTSAPSCPARRAGRSRWSITASSRSRSCSERSGTPASHPTRDRSAWPACPRRTPRSMIVGS